MNKRKAKSRTKTASKKANKNISHFNAKLTKSNVKKQTTIINRAEKRLHLSIKKLHRDIVKKATRSTLMKDHAQILLLFGECNYLAKEWNAHKKWDRRNRR